MSDQYAQKGAEPDLDRFCEILENSPVAVFAITDYFSLDGYLSVKQTHRRKFPNSSKLLLPAVEFRLLEQVDGDHVDFHVVFDVVRPDEELGRIVGDIPTQMLSEDRIPKKCAHLRSKKEFNEACVERDDLLHHLQERLGEHAHGRDYLTMCPVRDHGVRTKATQGKPRRNAEQIERDANALLGNETDREHYLDEDRYQSLGIKAKPKPVVTGCDSHSFTHLEKYLGKDGSDGSEHRNALWIKADTTFKGLLQILAEPGDRVRLGEARPDAKESFHWIRRIKFDSEELFPESVDFNQNLNAIIGSRSSGKSALLAYIAHAVDEEATETRQRHASNAVGENPSPPGPGAGLSWEDVNHIGRTVEWADSSAVGGKVIYIPQNYLYSFHERPEEITDLLRESLNAANPNIARDHVALEDDLKEVNRRLRSSIGAWWSANAKLLEKQELLRAKGDSAAIDKSLEQATADLETMRAEKEMTTPEAKKAQGLHEELENARETEQDLHEEIADLEGRVDTTTPDATSLQKEPVEVEIVVRPSVETLPEAVQDAVSNAIGSTTAALADEIGRILSERLSRAQTELSALLTRTAAIRTDNAELLAKSTSSDALEQLQTRYDALARTKREVGELKQGISEVEALKSEAAKSVQEVIEERSKLIETGVRQFNDSDYSLQQFTVAAEADIDHDKLVALAEPINKATKSKLIKGAGEGIDIAQVRVDAAAVLDALASGRIKLKAGKSAQEVSRSLLLATEEIRMTAEYDDDKVGGFSVSTMTPGKRALVALLLMLAQEDEPWPLLLDQPEDDLDSRSIYREIVPELIARKRERQIIMVSHDANLVVGADAECVVVANRHGSGAQNKNDRRFDYLSGPLEDSKIWSPTKKHALSRGGIREHACQILDGGKDAFRKRQEKYAI